MVFGVTIWIARLDRTVDVAVMGGRHEETWGLLDQFAFRIPEFCVRTCAANGVGDPASIILVLQFTHTVMKEVIR